MTNNKLFSELILNWYKKNKRDLPWRKTKDPYKIWVSEIILQQTQVKTGLKYYKKFLERYPSLSELASSSEIDLLNIWQGLGYYNRALNMLETSKLVEKKYNSVFPTKYDILIKLKGIGPYTAAAISSICIDEKKAVLDGNVFRILSRYYNIVTPIDTVQGKKEYQKKANILLPNKNCGEYNQGMMDFGSIICTKHTPKCTICPINTNCQAFILKNIEKRPLKLKKNKLKKRYFNYFFITKNSHFFIKKRLSLDIWHKLFEMPLVESSKKLQIEEIKKNNYFNLTQDSNFLSRTNTIHLLSHQKLIISFWELKCGQGDNNWVKINFNQISMYPFPKPIVKYFKAKKLTM